MELNYYKPTKTIYKGVKFRSRLESMWAAVFDGCGATWEYEPKGLHLCLLPDFLVNGRIAVEVKPTGNLESLFNEWERSWANLLEVVRNDNLYGVMVMGYPNRNYEAASVVWMKTDYRYVFLQGVSWEILLNVNKQTVTVAQNNSLNATKLLSK